MKHCTHIYLANKAIELLRESTANTLDEKGKYLKNDKKDKHDNRRRTNETLRLKKLERLFTCHLKFVDEASWVPDDILRDNDPYHIFKLFTLRDFPSANIEGRDVFIRNGVAYYKFAGGMPYRIDHIMQEIMNMSKLRDYNDQYSLRQILYKYLLASHYIVDAHVPMHCDLRDDPPSSSKSQPSRRAGKSSKPAGKYMKSSAHAKLEGIWEDAVKKLTDDPSSTDPLSMAIKLGPDDCKRGGKIKVRTIKKGELHKFLIDICIESKKNCELLFPPDDPQTLDESQLVPITEKIFTSAVADLISIWRYVYVYAQEED